jgi:hypothetical protein
MEQPTVIRTGERALGPPLEISREKRWLSRITTKLIPYAFILPALIFYTVFLALPILARG